MSMIDEHASHPIGHIVTPSLSDLVSKCQDSYKYNHIHLYFVCTDGAVSRDQASRIEDT